MGFFFIWAFLCIVFFSSVGMKLLANSYMDKSLIYICDGEKETDQKFRVPLLSLLLRWRFIRLWRLLDLCIYKKKCLSNVIQYKVAPAAPTIRQIYPCQVLEYYWDESMMWSEWKCNQSNFYAPPWQLHHKGWRHKVEKISPINFAICAFRID